MSCSICSYTSSFVSEYVKHPIGKGATMTDYALSVVLGLILLYVVYRVAKEIR